jgi:broad specificity phosphatase PhoE
MYAMARLYLARHGESQANTEGVFSNRDVDHPLTELGLWQARALAEWLEPKGVSAVYASPIRRAQQTAGAVSTRVGAPIVTCEDLREVDVGDLEGRRDEEAWAVYHDVVQRWRQGELGARFPDGEDGFRANERVGGILTEIADRHPTESVAVISHGEVLSQVLSRLVKLPPGAGTGLDVGAVVVADHGHGVWSCAGWNSTEHLARERDRPGPDVRRV